MEKIQHDLQDLHLVQLELLKSFIHVCNNHKFVYYLGFGSLLGAVREKKILDWDDSIDVVMPYCDYVKLITLPQKEWGKNLFMQTYDSDPQYPRYYAKLRDSSTTLIKADYAALDINQGIYINIMPIINLSDDKWQRSRQMKDAKLYKVLTEKQPLPAEDGVLRLYASLLLGLLHEPRRKKNREALKQRVIKYVEEKTKECIILAGNVSLALPLSSSWFGSPVEWTFENMIVNIPKGWHEWLELRYGDYMIAPISEIQGDKTSKFVTLNTRRPYIEYKGKTYCVSDR